MIKRIKITQGNSINSGKFKLNIKNISFLDYGGKQIMRSLWEPDISTAVSNNQQAEFGTATEESEVQNAAPAAFPKLFTCRVETGFFCYSVMLLPENCCSTSLFTTGYKRLPEGGG
jgi:hypothetical protein